MEDVARANLAALEDKLSGACNVGTGQQLTLLELIEVLAKIIGEAPGVRHEPPREGDIRHSLANVERMNRELGINAKISMEDGLRSLIEYSNPAN